MISLSVLLIVYFTIVRILISCRSYQQICVNQNEPKCQTVLKSKLKHLQSFSLTSDLCCPILESSECLKRVLEDCGVPKEVFSSFIVKPIGCAKFDDGVSCTDTSYDTVEIDGLNDNNSLSRYQDTSINDINHSNNSGSFEYSSEAKNDCALRVRLIKQISIYLSFIIVLIFS